MPTINLASAPREHRSGVLAALAAKRLDSRRRQAVAASSRRSSRLPTLVLRWWELWALNTRWDTTAYGSAAWTIVGFHTSLLLLDVLDTHRTDALLLPEEAAR